MADLKPSQIWRRSRRCDTAHCVEVAFDPDRSRVYLRNSVEPEVHLVLSAEAWRVFCAAIAAGELDQPATGAG